MRTATSWTTDLFETLKADIAVLAYASVVPVCICATEHVLMNCLVRGAHHLSWIGAIARLELVRVRDF